MTGEFAPATSAPEVAVQPPARAGDALPPAGPGLRRRTVARACGAGALVALAGTVITFAALHLLPPTSTISPLTRTISEYALTSSAWAFDLGVLLLVAASVAAFSGLALLGRVRVVSAGTIFGALWAAGLLTLVSFPKHNWALGTVSTTGQVHRLASLVAFLALPVAVISIARRRGAAAHPTPARCAFWLGVLSLVWFSPLVYAVVSAPLTGQRWWQAIPLGLVERGMTATEVLAVVALAVLLIGAARPAGMPVRGAAQPPAQ